MSKHGRSEPDFWGGYTHYDENGDKIGTSRPNLFGGYTEYDSSATRWAVRSLPCSGDTPTMIPTDIRNGLKMQQAKDWVTRYNQRKEKIAAGILPRTKGRPRDGASVIRVRVNASVPLTSVVLGTSRPSVPPARRL
jgi:hypothetical protein